MTNKEFKKLKNDLWLAANKLRADSNLKSNDYGPPVLGIIFLKFADIKYSKFEKDILAEYIKKKGTRLEEAIEKIAIEKMWFIHSQQKPLRIPERTSGRQGN